MELICCVCTKVKRNGRWVRETPAAGLPQSHGYCHDCFEAALRELHALRETPASAPPARTANVA